jgi:hypothetical protein
MHLQAAYEENLKVLFSCMDYISAAVKKETDVVKIVLPVVASLLILTCICLVWICKSRGTTTLTSLLKMQSM